MVQLTRQLTSVAVWLPPKKQVQQHLKQKKTEKHLTLVKTPTHLRALGGETAIITTREPTTLPTHSNMRITVKEQMCAPCFCVWCLLVCAFWNKKNLTRLDDWGLCAHQRCAFGKTVTAGAKGGGGRGQNRGDSELKTKNKNPSSGKSKHCFGFVYILPNYSACGINCATTTMFTTLMALRRHHL